MNNILIATDGSEAADEALEVAIDMALEARAALNVLSVRRPRPAGVAAPARHPRGRDAGRAQAHRRGGCAARSRGRRGCDAARRLRRHRRLHCDTANALGADHLVVGSRGLGSMSAAMLGSVSHALVRRSPVPLTIVRRPAVHA